MLSRNSSGKDISLRRISMDLDQGLGLDLDPDPGLGLDLGDGLDLGRVSGSKRGAAPSTAFQTRCSAPTRRTSFSTPTPANTFLTAIPTCSATSSRSTGQDASTIRDMSALPPSTLNSSSSELRCFPQSQFYRRIEPGTSSFPAFRRSPSPVLRH